MIDGLQCSNCRAADLRENPDLLACRSCGQLHPVLGGVPIMFDTVSVEMRPSDDDEPGAREIALAFGLSDDPLTLLRLRSLLRTKARFGGTLVQVESRQFLHRVRNTRNEDAPERATFPGKADVAYDVAQVPRYRWCKDYLPRLIAPGAPLLANMRIENVGPVPLRAEGAGRVLVALRWRHRDGTPVIAPDERTPLPIDVAPGCALTIAVSIVPPADLDAYLLTVTLVQEQVRWLDEDAMTVTVTVADRVLDLVPDGWVVLPDAPPSYDVDHDRGVAILRDWLASHAPPRPRVLEVGGNAVSMLGRLDTALDADLVNVDVDLLGLQVGRLLARRHGSPVRYVCADAFDLPFGPSHFDAIVIFASLHHFPDPAALLERLAQKLRVGGFIGLFCEPVGHVWPGAVPAPFLAELQRGVNEQSFSLREYELIFRRAGLVPADVLVDRNSLKARLLHCPRNRPL